MIKIKPAVTRVTKSSVTKLAPGRPRKHGTAAERQKAYRERVKRMDAETSLAVNKQYEQAHQNAQSWKVRNG